MEGGFRVVPFHEHLRFLMSAILDNLTLRSDAFIRVVYIQFVTFKLVTFVFLHN